MAYHSNPFSVKTPESLSPKELVELFVPFPEFDHVREPGHLFLHGHRGSGKSMMLRMLEPASVLEELKCHPSSIPYFGCYLSIKATEINQPEFGRFENAISGFVLAEHVLALKILSQVISSVIEYQTVAFSDESPSDTTRCIQFRDDWFIKNVKLAGWDDSTFGNLVNTNRLEILRQLSDISKAMEAQTLRYVKKQAFVEKIAPYDGSLIGFQDTLLPIIRGLKETGLIPQVPFYILLDDADNLTLQQTKILNTWVSYRSTAVASLKISTQQGYKTWTTSSGVPIEAPHDFSEMHFTTVRTGANKSRYFDMVSDIVRKRLDKYGFLGTDPKTYFPEDAQQSAEIAKIEEELRSNWNTAEKRGYRPNDDSYRAARPEYIRRLGGSSKQGSTYKYAGFDQLVHISSGTIRFFLDPAAKMYSQALEKNANTPPPQIPSDIQDACIREQSDSLVLAAFDNLKDEVKTNSTHQDSLRDIDHLRNLITNVGSLFQSCLMDENASQRRVFSFHIAQDDPSEKLRQVLKLGIEYGYFYKSSIGRKNGNGRSTLYVMSRRLAPAFKLDPVGFSGYMSITGEELAGYLYSSTAWKRKGRGVTIEQSQLMLDYIDGAGL